MRKKTSKIWTIGKVDLADLVAKSASFAEILKRLGLVVVGCQYRILKHRLATDGIDFSHIATGLGSNRGRHFKSSPMPMSQMLTEQSVHSRRHLKRRLLADGLLKNECALCHGASEWQGKPLVMVLDHINGIGNDNRLENLRLLCPNCNSQQPTFSGRNAKRNKKVSLCADCGTSISKQSKRCGKCYAKSRLTIGAKLTADDMSAMMKTSSWEDIGHRFGVSGATAKETAKRMGLAVPVRRRGNGTALHRCAKCGSLTKNEKYCSRRCNSLSQRKADRPSPNDLLVSIQELGVRGAARKYGVTHSVLTRSWLKPYPAV